MFPKKPINRIVQLWSSFSDTKIYPGHVVVSTIAGNGDGHHRDGDSADASFGDPIALCIDEQDNIFVTDGRNHRVRKVCSATGYVSTLVGTPSALDDKTASHLTLDMYGQTCHLNWPAGIAVRPDTGDVVVSGRFGQRIVAINSTTGTLTLLAGNGEEGHFDGPSDKSTFRLPRGTAIDPLHPHRIVVCDQSNHCIRLIDTNDHTVTTLAGIADLAGHADGSPPTTCQFRCPRGVAFGPRGELYVADGHNHCIRKIFNDTVSTIAGKHQQSGWRDGDAKSAMFSDPMALCVAEEGTVLYVADRGNHCIRKIAFRGGDVTGEIGASVVTLAGAPQKGYKDGAGEEAQFFRPTGVAVGSDGMLYVADCGNRRIRGIYSVPEDLMNEETEMEFEKLEAAVAKKMEEKASLLREIEEATQGIVTGISDAKKTKLAEAEAAQQIVSLQVRLQETHRVLKAVMVQRTLDLAKLNSDCTTLSSKRDVCTKELDVVNANLLATQHSLAKVNAEKTELHQRLQLLSTRVKDAIVDEESERESTSVKSDGPCVEGSRPNARGCGGGHATPENVQLEEEEWRSRDEGSQNSSSTTVDAKETQSQQGERDVSSIGGEETPSQATSMVV